MTARLRRKLIWLFLFFTMLAFTLLLLFFAERAVLSEQNLELAAAARLADNIANELLQGRTFSEQDLMFYADDCSSWVCLWDEASEKTGPECFPSPTAGLMEQIRAGTEIIESEMEETISSRQMEICISRMTHLLTGTASETYYAVQIDIQTPNLRNQGVILIYPRSSRLAVLWKHCRLYPLLWLVLLAAMYTMSRLLIGKALRPVEASIKSQKEFIAAASHELKAPLAVIQAHAETMEPADGESVHSAQTTILEECAHMAKLLESLLSLAAKDAGSWQMDMQETDMDTLLIETWEAFLPACRKKKITLKLDTGDECCPRIFCDPERTGQVFRILLDNALEHAPSGSSIELKAVVCDRAFVCSVTDHGPGIPDSQKSRVFERFYCGDASHTDKNHFGLGLSIAKEIAGLHQGALVLSDTPGGGCTFTLRLPLPPSGNAGV